jgi:hypothetical protein
MLKIKCLGEKELLGSIEQGIESHTANAISQLIAMRQD